MPSLFAGIVAAEMVCVREQHAEPEVRSLEQRFEVPGKVGHVKGAARMEIGAHTAKTTAVVVNVGAQLEAVPGLEDSWTHCAQVSRTVAKHIVVAKRVEEGRLC
jgi:UDP-N-acetylenolpyruvoylglucosamine reductase